LQVKQSKGNYLSNEENKVCYFADSVRDMIVPPERFTYPFNYEPHPLAILATTELQHYLETQTELDHDFGLTPDTAPTATGKMFGVLVIQDRGLRLGYLSAFSGKLAGANHHPKFVPPVFDMLTENSFFVKGIKMIDAINAQVSEIESSEIYMRMKLILEQFVVQSQQEISSLKQQLKTNKEIRNQVREQQKKRLSEHEFSIIETDLAKQSVQDKRQLRDLIDKWQKQIGDARKALMPFDTSMEALRNERREKSALLQVEIFEQYVFLNKDGEGKSLQDIFKEHAFGKPPAAAGECATPKLLQYAFLNGYKPLAMAEFWWGASPKSEIRKHKQFYPACTTKCKPILAHMLEGMAIDQS
jgi:tRNA pseudouridine32 synthase/23S rRNA pseudouridine746 synthase